MKTTNKILEPSFLAFNERNYNKQLDEIINIGINCIHFDIIEKEYVNNDTFYSLEFAKKIIDKNITISVHIMGYEIDKYVDFFKDLNIYSITFQIEPIIEKKSLNNLINAFKIFKDKNIKSGIAINPNTNIDEYIDIIKDTEIITIMSVIAGFGGQKFMVDSLDNLKKAFFLKNNQNLEIQIDGGINKENLELVLPMADRIISGSSFIKMDTNEKNLFLKKIKNYYK